MPKQSKNALKEKKQFIIVKSLVIDNDRKILFVRRKREWHAEAHDKWEFPGGKVDFGEYPEKTAIREVKEESGYNVKVNVLIPKILTSQWEFEDRISQQILICYACKLKSGSASIEDHGVSEVKWFHINKVPKRNECLPGTIEFLAEYKKMLKN